MKRQIFKRDEKKKILRQKDDFETKESYIKRENNMNKKKINYFETFKK